MKDKYSYFYNEQGEYSVVVEEGTEDEQLIAICFDEIDAKLVINALNISNKLKKSTQLEKEAAKEDNDLKALGIMNKALREKRAETWGGWKDKVLMSVDVIGHMDYMQEMGKFIISTETYGVLDYYPKVNKLLIRKDNRWVKPGLKWLIDNLIEKQ